MKICVYGGSFDPPHRGHVAAAQAVSAALQPDVFLLIPDCVAPHKLMAGNTAAPEQRLELCKLAFGGIPHVEISDMEINRGGKSYTSDTLHELMAARPGDTFCLLVGTDMLLSFEKWYDFRWILEHVELAAFPRQGGEEAALREHALYLTETYGTRIHCISLAAVPTSSTDVRSLLPERRGREALPEEVYAYVIRHRLYGAQPDFAWLREQAYAMLKPKRVPHVRGCEQEAVRLARRYGADEALAAEGAILHDITKKLDLPEQLRLCEKYGIVIDEMERQSSKLLHARTGAAVAKDRFGVCDEVCEAIRWHTTGKADMSLLEKILYLADYIEPTRDFEGVEALRKLAYEDLDEAMCLGFRMSLEDLKHYGVPPHRNTVEALSWLEGTKHGA